VSTGARRAKVMQLSVGEFMRRFLLHVLPRGFVAFGTMDCSPTATGPTSWRYVASCWAPWKRQQRSMTVLVTTMPRLLKIRRPAPVAAVA
jgi:hypothetical protein